MKNRRLRCRNAAGMRTARARQSGSARKSDPKKLSCHLTSIAAWARTSTPRGRPHAGDR
jgi:hypothetical protein